VFRPEKWKEFLKAELKRLDNNEDIHDAEIMNK
jgi:tryptophan synthase beta chain